MTDLTTRVAALEETVAALAQRERIRNNARRRHAKKKAKREKPTPGQFDGSGVSGVCIRAARIAAGWTPAQVAALAGVAVGTARFYELGYRKVPVFRAKQISAGFLQAGKAPPKFAFPADSPP